jgi:DNA-binding beta-propeller fold protein YncE/mono/diheme cytochrome c family protein
VIPTDTRAVVEETVRPVPLSGGTLAVSKDGAFAVAADSARDRVFVIDTVRRKLVHDIALQPGDEPGRVVAGEGHELFVALRRGGAVLSVDAESGAVVRRAACLAPRGMAWDASNEQLLVACAEGTLVTFQGDDAAPTQVVEVAPDLRDVVIANGRTLVSRFRAAEVVELDAAQQIVERHRPAAASGSHVVFHADGSAVSEGVSFEAAVAWRTVATPDGTVFMLHQRDQVEEIAVPHPDDDTEEDDDLSTVPGGGDPYGGSGPCQGIVRTAVTAVTREGNVRTQFAPTGALAVDMAISPTGRFMAVANAGLMDQLAPVPTIDGTPVSFNFIGNSLHIISVPQVDGENGPEPADPQIDQGGSAADSCTGDEQGIFTDNPVVAVAFHPVNEALLYAQSRYGFVVVDLISRAVVSNISLGQWEAEDTGYSLFHQVSGAGVACASCHPEGMDDGHVWSFEGMGERRTQGLDVGLEGTAPFHWDGTLGDLSALMDEVFVGRMGGVFQSPDRLQALQNWVFSIQSLPPRRAADESAVVRGQELFHSAAVGCATCHSGGKLTNNLSVAVRAGQTQLLQVPSLVGVGYRAPLMHDGCAATLRDRFTPECGGGDSHGHTSHLSDAELDDLVAYMESL